MLYMFSYERPGSQVLDSAGREPAIELRAATEGKTVAAFLTSLMASDNVVTQFQEYFLSRALKLISIWLEAIFNNYYTF